MAFMEYAKAVKLAPAKTFAPHDERDAGDDADRHLRARADPIVFDGELEEIRQPNQHGDDADAVQPLAANARLQETAALRRSWSLRNELRSDCS